MKWREKWGADDIENWNPPKVFEKYIPHGTTGFDKDNCIIIVCPFHGKYLVLRSVHSYSILI